jgi:hypothetical protein
MTGHDRRKCKYRCILVGWKVQADGKGDLVAWADECAEPADDIDPALVQQHSEGFADGVAGETGFLHQRDLAGQLGAGRVRAIVNARPQVVRELDMLGHIGTI